MENQREGASSTRPSFLNGTNYSLWKSRMKIYLGSTDRKIWSSVVNGWTPPTLTDVAGVIIELPDDKWTTTQELSCQYNDKALYAIFSAIDVSQQLHIIHCKSAKEA